MERFLFQPFKPFEPPELPKPKRKARVKKTKVGRVVYNRKRHFFSTKDLKRILKNILENDMGKEVGFDDFLVEWGEVQLLMLDLLASQGGFIGSNPLFDLVAEGIRQLMAGKTSIPEKTNKEK